MLTNVHKHLLGLGSLDFSKRVKKAVPTTLNFHLFGRKRITRTVNV